jgi:[ribosomal protein S18]-alanine N-acetyltransferase
VTSGPSDPAAPSPDSSPDSSTGPVRLRPFDPDDEADLAAVAGLEAALFGVEAWSCATWSGLVDGPGRRAWVATTPAGGVIGHALSGTVGDFAELLRIGVRPDARRGGVATRLLEEVVRAAAADGADRLLLEVSDANAAARAFYEAHGFVRIDVRPRYYRDGADALVLERRVAASGRMEP